MRFAPLWVQQFGLAVTSSAFATAVLLAISNRLPHWFNLPIVVLAYLLAINMTTQFAGLAAGLTSSVIAFLLLNFFFIDPRGTLLVNNETDLLLLFVFLVIALLNNQFLSRALRRQQSAELRERDAMLFYEFSLELIGLRDAGTVAQSLANRLQKILAASAAQVTLTEPNDATTVWQAGQAAPSLTQPAQYWCEPIASARGALGEICITRLQPLTLEEQRIVRTFASEAGLVLERFRMVQAEARTQVLEESDRLKSALLASVSHELRTPLATIRAGTESLSRGIVQADSAVGKELVNDISDAAQHLTKLVTNMLDMTRIESGALHPQREWNDLIEIVNNATNHLRGDLGAHTLRIDVPDDLPLLPVDPVQIDQVFTNLISNSAKYAPPNTVIEIVARIQDADFVLVQVKNQSQHLPETNLERIFDKFYRVTHASQVTGTGLGLSICKGIIEAHSGRIWASNVVGADRGFIFNFTLPRTWNGESPRAPMPESEGS